MCDDFSGGDMEVSGSDTMIDDIGMESSSDADIFEISDSEGFDDIGIFDTENELAEYSDDENEFAEIEPADLGEGTEEDINTEYAESEPEYEDSIIDMVEEQDYDGVELDDGIEEYDLFGNSLEDDGSSFDADSVHSVFEGSESGEIFDLDNDSEDVDLDAEDFDEIEEPLFDQTVETEDRVDEEELNNSLEQNGDMDEIELCDDAIPDDDLTYHDAEDKSTEQELDLGETDVSQEENELQETELDVVSEYVAENLEEDLAEEKTDLVEDLEDDIMEEKTADTIRQLTEQNVTDSVFPKSHGHWQDEDEVGNSKWILDDDAEISWKKSGESHSITGKELKEKYDIEGVEYFGNEPDFEPFEDDMIGHVELDDFSDQRTGKVGTYTNATKAAADKLGMDTHEIEKYMDENGLTWHECGDRKTVRAIPTEINAAFKHTGGIGIERSLKAMSEELNERYGDMALQRESRDGIVSPEEIESAVESIHQSFRDRKRGK